MPVAVFKTQRYPASDREELAKAAASWCRAIRSIEGARARFYWDGPNTIAFFVEADSSAALMNAIGNGDGEVPSELSQAQFAMADFAASTGIEIWVDPRRGEEAYRAAGRL